MLQKIEHHYVDFLKEFRNDVLENIDQTIDQQNFLLAFDTILNCHEKMILPILSTPGISIAETCKLFKSCLEVSISLTFNIVPLIHL